MICKINIRNIKNITNNINKIKTICATLLFLLLLEASSAWAGWNDDNLARVLQNRHEEFFSFVVVGDTQGPNSKFPQVLPAILKEENLLFVFNLGDLVNYATPEEYESTFFRHVRGLDLPFLTCASNHDHFKSKNAANYSHLFGSPHYYSFAIRSTCFIVLDNGQDTSLNETQFSWLEKTLERSQSFARRFVMMHRPLRDPRSNRKKPHDMSERPHDVERLNALFDRYDVTMIFTGHIHSFYTGKWGKTPYIITGGGGGGLYDKGTPASFHHYIRVDIAPSGKVAYQAIKVDVIGKK
ncbi:MAG: metallophosphoesterase [Synergistaceae bacterium]|nr:metallophosphoesterase [Synergistaceae bacterium]